jgi:hypothetical protein
MKNRLSIVLLVMLATAAPVFAQQVSVNYNHSQDFTQYHTYAMESKNPNQINNSILAQVAKSDIEAALQAKGLTKVDPAANPDLILLASGGLQQQTSYQAWGMRGIGGGMGGITPEQNVVGTMIIDLYDAKQKTLVWRGIAQDTLSNNGDKNQKMIGKAVQKMFKQYP